MAGSKTTYKWLLLAMVGLSLVLMAYNWLDVPEHDYISIEDRVNNPVNIRMIDSGIHMLQQGDIVVRTGNDITSTMFLKMNQTDKTYSHCGIVMIENGYPFIYHSIGGEDNPDETLRRDSASFWFSPRHNMGFGILRFNLTTTQSDSLKYIVQQYYTAHKKFDLDFDLSNDSQLYCSEFVHHALNYAMADTGFIKTTRWMGRDYIAVDNFTCNPHAHLICQVRYK